MRFARGLTIVLGLLLLTVLGGPVSPSVASTIESPLGAARGAPSPTTKMICSREARGEISAVLTVKVRRMTRPTWIDAQYSCGYVLRAGAVTVSVAEFTDAAATTAYFAQLGAQLDRRPEQILLGEDAFTGANGSVVVRKDDKVLTVDVSQLGPETGTQHRTPADIALSVAAVILGCWTGA